MSDAIFDSGSGLTAQGSRLAYSSAPFYDHEAETASALKPAGQAMQGARLGRQGRGLLRVPAKLRALIVDGLEFQREWLTVLLGRAENYLGRWSAGLKGVEPHRVNLN